MNENFYIHLHINPLKGFSNFSLVLINIRAEITIVTYHLINGDGDLSGDAGGDGDGDLEASTKKKSNRMF